MSLWWCTWYLPLDNFPRWRVLYPGCIMPGGAMSDQDRISPYNINTISTKQVMRIMKKCKMVSVFT